MNTKDTLYFAELLKSGNTKFTSLTDAYYFVPTDDKKNPAIPLDAPLTLTYRVEKKGDKQVKIIEDWSFIQAGTPSLPKTTVTDTVAPGGEMPVKAAKKADVKANYGGDFQKPWLPEEARRVAILNIITSCLTSPGYAQECVGRNSEEIDATFRRAVQKAIKLYEESIQPIE